MTIKLFQNLKKQKLRKSKSKDEQNTKAVTYFKKRTEKTKKQSNKQTKIKTEMKMKMKQLLKAKTYLQSTI